MPDHIAEAQYREICEFLYLECQFADEGRWEEWESLLADDMHYWVPVGGSDADPDRDVSIINDNRTRLRTRLRQLKTGTRHSQSPISVLRRMLANIVMRPIGDDLLRVEANFVAFEFQSQSTMLMNTWPGRVRYHLRRTTDSYEIVLKRIDLVMASGPMPTLAFII